MGARASSNRRLKAFHFDATFLYMKSLFASLALLAFSAAPLSATEGPARPALWQLSDQDTTIYLFGTIHALPKDLVWQTPVLLDAENKADELVMEIGDLEDQAKGAAALMKVAFTPNLPPLSERLPPKKRAKLAALIVKSGIPAPLLDKMETWAAALGLTAGLLKGTGIDPANGVEHRLMSDFRSAHKPVSGLESFDEQYGLFDTLPENEQRAFLGSLVDGSGNATKEFAKMLAGWREGDETSISRSFDKSSDITPILRERLVFSRNANWARWIEARMQKPGTILIAVGAGHLAGHGSVRVLLARRGFKTKRIQ